MQLLKRIGIIGDVHTEQALLASVLAFLQAVPKLDALLCTGDLVTGPGDADRVCDLLQNANVFTVRGNHDRWFFLPGYDGSMTHTTPHDALSDRNRAYLAALPPTRTFDTPSGSLLLCHGTGTDDMIGIYPNDTEAVLAANHPLYRIYAERQVRFLVCGHTHAPMLRTFDHLTIINPGTLRRERRPGFFLADFTTGTLQAYRLNPDTGDVLEAEEATL